MNAVQDFLGDQARVEETLVIPAEIRTLSGYLVDTTSSTWLTPPHCTNFYWDNFKGLGAFSRTLQAFAAALLDGKSEGYATIFNSVCTAVATFGGWQVLATQWVTKGEIDFDTLLQVKEALLRGSPKTGGDDFGMLRRWYKWANGLRVPGFTDETLDRLESIKLGNKVPYFVGQKLVPGASKSRTSKNRRTYTDVDFSRIQAALLRLEARLNSGEIILSNGTDISLLQKRIHVALKERAIGTKHLVMAWLACMFGERPKALCSLRESSFKFYEVDGLQLGTVVFAADIKRNYGKRHKPAERSKLPLNAELIRLVPRLITENRTWANIHGIEPDCDLPLFPIKIRRGLSPARSTVEDEGKRMTRDSQSISQDLKAVFRILNVHGSDGSLIIPTFYSHRDGNATRWSRAMPLESVAEIHGKKGIASLKHYVKPGIRHVSTLDSVPEYTELAGLLKSPVPTETIDPRARIPSPFPYVLDGDGKHRVGVEGGCGCFGSSCPMAFDGTVDCYVCNAFTPVVEGPHDWTLKVLIDKKADMIDRGLPRTEWSRYDRHIAAVGEVIRLVQEYWLARKKEKPE